MTSVLSVFDTLNAHQRPMVGDTKMSAVAIDHVGWLKCDGRLLNVSDYYFLWETIGYSFGGSGSQFYLPDPAGRVIGTIGTSVENTWAMGDLSGEENHTLTIDEMPTHNHTGTTDLSGSRITHNAPGGVGQIGLEPANTGGAVTCTVYDATSGEANIYNAPAGLVLTDPQHKHTFTTANTGGSNAHNNMQPTLFMGNMFIYSGKPNDGKYPYFAGGLF